MQQFAIYLRKSRGDVEHEQREEIDVLQRHERLLLDLAHRQGLTALEIYREIVSGDSIAARPQMQALLMAVEQGRYAGVLVVDLDRLARGDTMDQGLVAQTFKFSNTKIITPMKTYDPRNEFDEEYFEFGLFMSRREYKIINRRLQRGRIAAVKEGKYVGNKAPYGYRRVKAERGWTLEPDARQAEIVRLIFALYTKGEEQEDAARRRLGISLIARRLNELKIPAWSGGAWSPGTIRDMLINPVYTGKVRWNWRPGVKKMMDGRLVIERPRADDQTCILADGLHEAIVEEEVFHLAQALMEKNPPRPVGERYTVKNPLAGIAVCGVCGRTMSRRPYGNSGRPDALMCPQAGCKTVSVPLHLVEQRILEALEGWLGGYQLKWEPLTHPEENLLKAAKQKALAGGRDALSSLEVQMESLHALLEQGVYTAKTFFRRKKKLEEEEKTIRGEIAALETQLEEQGCREISPVHTLPKENAIIDVYRSMKTAKGKNDLLKEVLERVVFMKNNKTARKGAADDFELILYPKLPAFYDDQG